MKRAALILAVLFVASSALAFDNDRKPRVAVLDSVFRNDDGKWESFVSPVQAQLTRELRRKGFDAYESGDTIVDVEERRVESDAEYFVEVVSDEVRSESWGGGGISHRGVSVRGEMIESRVAATIRLYDRDVNVLGTFDLDRYDRRVVPTEVGIGGRSGGIWLAVGIFEQFRNRSAMKSLVREAATRVAEAVKAGPPAPKESPEESAEPQAVPQ